MKFFKCAVLVIFVLTSANLGLTTYMYNKSKEHAEHQIVIPPNPTLRTALENGIVRDTQIMQAILMTHHTLGIHPPGKQMMCPLCEKKKDDVNNIITVQK